MEFYKALGPLHADYSTQIYGTYLSQAGFSPDIIDQKCAVFAMYAGPIPSPYPLRSPLPALSMPSPIPSPYPLPTLSDPLSHQMRTLLQR